MAAFGEFGNCYEIDIGAATRIMKPIPPNIRSLDTKISNLLSALIPCFAVDRAASTQSFRAAFDFKSAGRRMLC